MRLRATAFLVLGWASFAHPPEAAAGIPIIWGHGPTISRVADVPPGHPAIALHGPGTAVGYKYERFHIYWCDLWTWGGEFVFYNDNGFLPLGPDPKKAAEAAGLPGLSKPFLYHFPLGWLLIATFVFGSFTWERIKRANSPGARVVKLLKSPDYQDAAKLILATPDGKDRAIDHLIGRGVDLKKAQDNVDLLAAHLRSEYPPPAAIAPPPEPNDL